MRSPGNVTPGANTILLCLGLELGQLTGCAYTAESDRAHMRQEDAQARIWSPGSSLLPHIGTGV